VHLGNTGKEMFETIKSTLKQDCLYHSSASEWNITVSQGRKLIAEWLVMNSTLQSIKTSVKSIN
jgi:hypothetical protein